MNGIDIRVVYVLALVKDGPGQSGTRDQFMKSVEGSNVGGLSAS